MKLKVVVHEAEEGGYWAEVPALPGCVTQGETFEELLQDLYEAIEGWFDVEPVVLPDDAKTRIVDIAISTANPAILCVSRRQCMEINRSRPADFSTCSN